MKELGIVLDFRTKQITIDEIILPMRNINSLASTKIEKAWAVNNSMAQEPVSTKNTTQRVVEILDANYEKADLQAVVDTTGQHLSHHEKNKLLELLNEFEEMFDGTLDNWQTDSVSFDLKGGAKPNYDRPYPVTKYKRKPISKYRIDFVNWGYRNGVSVCIRMGISVFQNTQSRQNAVHNQ